MSPFITFFVVTTVSKCYLIFGSMYFRFIKADDSTKYVFHIDDNWSTDASHELSTPVALK